MGAWGLGGLSVCLPWVVVEGLGAAQGCIGERGVGFLGCCGALFRGVGGSVWASREVHVRHGRVDGARAAGRGKGALGVPCGA